MPSAACIYCRISQDRTGEGLGVARQEQDCRAWAERNGWTVAEVYVDDDISAYSGRHRPEYERMLADFKAGRRDSLIVWHPDRLHRSPTELESFITLVEHARIDIGTVTAGTYDLTTPDGRMSARIVGAVARHESEHKSVRIRRKHVELAERGAVAGGGRRPFGYEADRVTLRDDEAELIREAAQDVLTGKAVRSVASEWNARGVKSVTGAAWSATTVKRLLCAGRIVGWREHHGKLVAEATWPAIISAEDGRKLRLLLSDPARKLSGGENARSYLLSGMVYCGACGSPETDDVGARMTARPIRRKGHRYRRYACVTDRGGCNRCGIVADPLEALVVEAVKLRLDKLQIARSARRARKAPKQPTTVEEIEARLEELEEMYAAGEVDRAGFGRMGRRLDDRLTAAKTAEAGNLRHAAIELHLTQPGVLRKEWDGMGFDRQRVVLGAMIDQIVIAPTTKKGNFFDSERVDIRWRDRTGGGNRRGSPFRGAGLASARRSVRHRLEEMADGGPAQPGGS